jgi:hypothetical protein
MFDGRFSALVKGQPHHFALTRVQDVVVQRQDVRIGLEQEVVPAGSAGVVCRAQMPISSPIDLPLPWLAYYIWKLGRGRHRHCTAPISRLARLAHPRVPLPSLTARSCRATRTRKGSHDPRRHRLRRLHRLVAAAKPTPPPVPTHLKVSAKANDSILSEYT